MQQNNTTPEQPNGHATSEATATEFNIQRIYTKDISYESPNTPQLFREPWQPNVDVELNVNTANLGEDHYEVKLSITTTVKSQDKMAFLAEVHQAGIFKIQGFSGAQLHRMLGSYCPNILFPYIREAISDLVVRGGFPPLYLTPINFDVLYDQQLQKQQENKAAETTGDQ
ncbi:MAG TPA: protein-export chaperone SecB [Gammaproteobacteria bacterium]|nr:protein-export chaperone SecB [Gammaproteobacteria bacterium]